MDHARKEGHALSLFRYAAVQYTILKVYHEVQQQFSSDVQSTQVDGAM
jgi:hypothetical protein